MTEEKRQSYSIKDKDWQSRLRLREVYRYMGMKEEAADEALQTLVREQLDHLVKTACVRTYYQIYPLRFTEPGIMRLGNVKIQSQALGRNLKGCDHAALFGVTLGLDVDRLIYRLGRTAVGEAVIADACAAEAVEAVCDELCGRIGAEAERMGRKTRPRFSPGFGDFTLEYQPVLIHTLELPKRIGIHLTAGGMMTPAKSVTAVVGFYDPAAAGRLYDN